MLYIRQRHCPWASYVEELIEYTFIKKCNINMATEEEADP